MRSASSWRVPVLLALVLVAVDQATKHWAVNELADNRTIEVVWTLQFNLAFNSGMAFSRAEGLGPVIAIVATIVIVWLLASLRGVGGRLATIGMGFVIGGAAGNLIDRLFRGDAWLRGSVVDFIDFQWFPIFNVADMAINVGAGLLILNALVAGRRSSAPAEPGGHSGPDVGDAGHDDDRSIAAPHGETDPTTDDPEVDSRAPVGQDDVVIGTATDLRDVEADDTPHPARSDAENTGRAQAERSTDPDRRVDAERPRE